MLQYYQRADENRLPQALEERQRAISRQISGREQRESDPVKSRKFNRGNRIRTGAWGSPTVTRRGSRWSSIEQRTRFGAKRATMKAVILETIRERGDLTGHSPYSPPLRSGAHVAPNPARSAATP